VRVGPKSAPPAVAPTSAKPFTKADLYDVVQKRGWGISPLTAVVHAFTKHEKTTAAKSVAAAKATSVADAKARPTPKRSVARCPKSKSSAVAVKTDTPTVKAKPNAVAAKAVVVKPTPKAEMLAAKAMPTAVAAKTETGDDDSDTEVTMLAAPVSSVHPVRTIYFTKLR